MALPGDYQRRRSLLLQQYPLGETLFWLQLWVCRTTGSHEHGRQAYAHYPYEVSQDLHLASCLSTFLLLLSQWQIA
jgi:hypothetical protein